MSTIDWHVFPCQPNATGSKSRRVCQVVLPESHHAHRRASPSSSHPYHRTIDAWDLGQLGRLGLFMVRSCHASNCPKGYVLPRLVMQESSGGHIPSQSIVDALSQAFRILLIIVLHQGLGQASVSGSRLDFRSIELVKLLLGFQIRDDVLLTGVEHFSEGRYLKGSWLSRPPPCSHIIALLQPSQPHHRTSPSAIKQTKRTPNPAQTHPPRLIPSSPLAAQDESYSTEYVLYNANYHPPPPHRIKQNKDHHPDVNQLTHPCPSARDPNPLKKRAERKLTLRTLPHSTRSPPPSPPRNSHAPPLYPGANDENPGGRR